MKKMIIYGAGNEFKKFIAWYPLAVECIEKLLDSNIDKQGTEVSGIRIESPECIRMLEDNETVFISSHLYMSEISDTIRKLNPLVRIRLLDEQVKDKLFDYIIANHILEHISDEAKAICEMKRCLKDDSVIVLSFPVCMEIDTLEDEAYNTEELREKHYGQKDHVRLYGRDYKERLEKQGLIVEVFSPNEYLSEQDISLLGLIENDIVMLCRKVKINGSTVYRSWTYED